MRCYRRIFVETGPGRYPRRGVLEQAYFEAYFVRRIFGGVFGGVFFRRIFGGVFGGVFLFQACRFVLKSIQNDRRIFFRRVFLVGVFRLAYFW